MFRPASRALLRAPAVAARGPTTTRLISTSSSEAPKSRSWKNTVFRLGLAAGAIYYYNTASVFAKEPTFSFHSQPQADPEPSNAPTLDSIKPRIREEREKQQQRNPTAQPTTDADGTLKTPQELEEEASQEAAFNPETGEINWDCPCLGGMAHGPCGEDFKAAFSCFVYSQEEPKGIDCIEKFKGMQDCFRKYPEVYGAELEDDEEAAAATEAATEAAKGGPAASEVDASSNPDEKRAHAREVNAQVKAEAEKQPELAESEALMPKAWHDTEDKNEAGKTAK